MKKLYLHIGLGKTGSSALQSWLSLNSVALSRQGIDYADTVPQVKYGESLSGNGTVLCRACISQNFEEVESLLTSTYFYTPGNNVAIVSCELFQGMRASAILHLRDICARNAIEVCVIAYVRSAYEVLYSTYMQFVKRSSYTHAFGEEQSDLDFSKTVEYLQRYQDVFGSNMIILNYDAVKQDIYSSFCAATGIKQKNCKQLDKKVNRSLSFREVEVLRRVNRLHKGAFATQISDYLIGLAPEISTSVFYDELLVQQVRQDTQEQLRWINTQFQLTPKLVSDHYAGLDSAVAEVPDHASYQPIVQWALGFSPSEQWQTEFASFLKEFSAFMVEFSMEDTLALIKRAYEVQQLAIKSKAPSPQGEAAYSAHTAMMPRYLVSYFHDLDAPEVVDSTSAFSENFYAWIEVIEPHVVGSTINPVSKAHVLVSDDTEALCAKPAMSGFSILEAQSIDLVLTLAGNCPILDIGGFVEVAHIPDLLTMQIEPEKK